MYTRVSFGVARAPSARVEQRQLEVALEHAQTAGLAAANVVANARAYPRKQTLTLKCDTPYEFSEAMETIGLDVGVDGKWIVLALDEHWSKEARDGRPMPHCIAPLLSG